jgi:hypothetical protein
MKKLLAVFILLPCFLEAQQGASLQFISPSNTDRVALYGIGNINTEALANVNASGKFSGAFRLNNNSAIRKWTLFVSANRNASNGDSTLGTTLLFPEIGKASFIGTLNYMWKVNPADTSTFLGTFFQGSFKTINGKRSLKNSDIDTTAVFTMLDWQLGFRYLKVVAPNTRLSASAFLNYYNVPNEDNADYRLIFNDNNMPSEFWAIGVKIAAEINRLQFFADFRQTLGKETRMPSRDLRGFNLNIGFIFNADVFVQ